MRAAFLLMALAVCACGTDEPITMVQGDMVEAIGVPRACPTLADMAVDLESERSACFQLAIGQRGRVIEISRGVAKVWLEGYRREYFVRTMMLRRVVGAVGPVGSILPPRIKEAS